MSNQLLKNNIVMVILLITSITTVFAQLPIPDIFSPMFSHLSGRHNSDIQVELTTRTPNATIFYTLDGTTPNSASQKYSDKISIAGNETQITIKAITISEGAPSLISAATYIIDYSYNPDANYLTNLTWTEYHDFIKGDWFGYASTPWTNDYCVNLSIMDGGSYIDETTSTSGNYPFDDSFGPVFYYGSSAPSPKKKIELYDILPSGYANGFIEIVFSGGNTNTDQLRFIKFIDSRNLYLEMWHHDQYGPLKYFLTKNEPLITSIENESISLNSSIFPNPATDFLMIKNLDSNVKLTNHLGKVYRVEKNEKISISHIPRGFYTVNYSDTQGISINQKLILQ